MGDILSDKDKIQRLQAVLIKRYIEGKTWECIADEMFFSSVHIQRSLHPKALAEIDLKNV